MQQNKVFQQALRFVKQKHRGQFRAGEVPAWHHLLRVSYLLDFVLKQTGEGNSKERFIISLSALGHDLLEDTNAKEDEIRSIFGESCLELILGTTNRWGDKKQTPYVRQVVLAEEAVRLIKLADLYDNISNTTYSLYILGRKWTTSYFLPIVLPMRRAIIKTKFYRYRKSAEHLISLVNAATMLLEKELRNY